MIISTKDIEQAIIRARELATREGVAAENLEATASAIAVLELLNPNNGNSANQMDIAGEFQETFAEWAARFKLETNYDRFLAAALYLREQKQIKVVTISTIAQMFDRARWSKPKNFADVFAKAAQKRYFAEETTSDGKGWQVTRTGYEYFQSLTQ